MLIAGLRMDPVARDAKRVFRAGTLQAHVVVPEAATLRVKTLAGTQHTKGLVHIPFAHRQAGMKRWHGTLEICKW